MSFTLRELRSTASVLFPADDLSLLEVLYSSGDAFLAKLKPRTTTWTGSDRLTLSTFASTVKIGNRAIRVHSVGLTSLELTVAVQGETPDAIDALEEIWSWIAAGSSDPDATLSVGSRVYKTSASFVSKTMSERMFPGLIQMQKAIRTGTGIQDEGPSAFRIEVMANQLAHGMPLTASFTIEPRLTAKAGDTSYFSASPLTSDQHIAVLETLCAE